MKIIAFNNFVGLLIVTFLPLLVVGCQKEEPKWHIKVGGTGIPKEQVLYEGAAPEEVKVCLDGKGGSGYPTTVIATFDDDRYAGILVGQCMFFEGKRVAVRFGTPSSGKYAKGTYEIIAAK